MFSFQKLYECDFQFENNNNFGDDQKILLFIYNIETTIEVNQEIKNLGLNNGSCYLIKV